MRAAPFDHRIWTPLLVLTNCTTVTVHWRLRYDRPLPLSSPFWGPCRADSNPPPYIHRPPAALTRQDPTVPSSFWEPWLSCAARCASAAASSSSASGGLRRCCYRCVIVFGTQRHASCLHCWHQPPFGASRKATEEQRYLHLMLLALDVCLRNLAPHLP